MYICVTAFKLNVSFTDIQQPNRRRALVLHISRLNFQAKLRWGMRPLYVRNNQPSMLILGVLRMVSGMHYRK